MTTITVQSRVNPELKEEAEAVFSSMGMSIADAIRIFLHQCVNQDGLPFRPATKQALEELEKQMIKEVIRKSKASGIVEDYNIDRLISELNDDENAREKTEITLEIDRDILEWLRDTGGRYEERINQILRAMMELEIKQEAINQKEKQKK